MAHITLRVVNAAIKKIGGTAQLIRGDGYFYFADGEADNWHADSIYTMYLNDYTLEEWLGEYRDRRDAHAAEQADRQPEKEGEIAPQDTDAIHREAPQDHAHGGEDRQKHPDRNPAARRAEVPHRARAQCELAEMNDIELTAAAARAAGYNVEPRENGTEFAIEREGRWFPFAPIDDDGDAFRLMVALNIRWAFVTDSTLEAAAPAHHYRRVQVENGDKCAALRRAITLAAADVQPKGETK